MNLDEVIKQNTKSWSVATWLSNKEKSKNAVQIEGALLEHPAKEYVYFAPAPTEWSLVYQIKTSDISEIAPIGSVSGVFGDSYPLVRMLVRADTLVLRLASTWASEIPLISKRSDFPVLVDANTGTNTNRIVQTFAASDTPSPTPTPTGPSAPGYFRNSPSNTGQDQQLQGLGIGPGGGVGGAPGGGAPGGGSTRHEGEDEEQ